MKTHSIIALVLGIIATLLLAWDIYLGVTYYEHQLFQPIVIAILYSIGMMGGIHFLILRLADMGKKLHALPAEAKQKAESIKYSAFFLTFIIVIIASISAAFTGTEDWFWLTVLVVGIIIASLWGLVLILGLASGASAFFTAFGVRVSKLIRSWKFWGGVIIFLILWWIISSNSLTVKYGKKQPAKPADTTKSTAQPKTITKNIWGESTTFVLNANGEYVQEQK